MPLAADRIPMEARSIIFSFRIASSGLQSQVGILDWPLFGKVLLLSPNPSAHPARFRKAVRDYSARKRLLGRLLFIAWLGLCGFIGGRGATI